MTATRGANMVDAVYRYYCENVCRAPTSISGMWNYVVPSIYVLYRIELYYRAEALELSRHPSDNSNGFNGIRIPDFPTET